MAEVGLATQVAAITIGRLSFSFQLGDESELRVIRDLSLTIHRGEFVVIVGPSGCGKTTLLRLISGLTRFEAGSIEVEGRGEVGSAGIAHVFQDATLLPWRTVYENLALVYELRGVSAARTTINEKLGAVGLSSFTSAYPDELSGGMRSRVALARALVASPSILLLDEPFGSLDESTAEALCWQLLDLWKESGLTVLMVTHNMEHAVLLATRLLVATPRPMSIVADFAVLPGEKDAAFMRSPAFIDTLVRLRSAFRDGLEGHPSFPR